MCLVFVCFGIGLFWQFCDGSGLGIGVKSGDKHINEEGDCVGGTGRL